MDLVLLKEFRSLAWKALSSRFISDKYAQERYEEQDSINPIYDPQVYPICALLKRLDKEIEKRSK